MESGLIRSINTSMMSEHVRKPSRDPLDATSPQRGSRDGTADVSCPTNRTFQDVDVQESEPKVPN